MVIGAEAAPGRQTTKMNTQAKRAALAPLIECALKVNRHNGGQLAVEDLNVIRGMYSSVPANTLPTRYEDRRLRVVEKLSRPERDAERHERLAANGGLSSIFHTVQDLAAYVEGWCDGIAEVRGQ